MTRLGRGPLGQHSGGTRHAGADCDGPAVLQQAGGTADHQLHGVVGDGHGWTSQGASGAEYAVQRTPYRGLRTGYWDCVLGTAYCVLSPPGAAGTPGGAAPAGAIEPAAQLQVLREVFQAEEVLPQELAIRDGIGLHLQPEAQVLLVGEILIRHITGIAAEGHLAHGIDAPEWDDRPAGIAADLVVGDQPFAGDDQLLGGAGQIGSATVVPRSRLLP